ncbi:MULTISPECIES: aldo/keto reductase [unclassified Microbacterium]|uniref:aldo/keto reductase n=1 Tax=Microbacterium TaxID=33882 RepID=UPI000DE510BF|nr:MULTISPECIES: aldo/keto reductase [unclassified Microbacterium]NYF28778.1 aryl-alcohol dehydrogenase (NADP+) [Microbacterium sp. JAI119]RBO72314.1 aldo/keto reductase [Microbacterium sp. H6]
MHYRTLGRTGIQVSPFALGAMMLGTDGSIGNGDERDSIRIVHRAIDAGINIIDTADRYSQGGSEELIGKALAGRRDDVVLATKFNGPMGTDPNRRGNSRRWIMRAVEDSLRRLGTDYIDLYQAHRPDDTVDLEETLSALTDLVRSGKVRAIGSSDFPASMQVEAQWTSERRGLERFRTEQPTYSILNRGIEREVLPVAQRYGMGALVWSPLAGGMLTGRFRRGQQTDLARATMFRHNQDERRIDAVEQIVALSEETGIRMTHLAMAFAIAHPDVTSALIGPRSMEQLDDLLAGVDIALTDEVLDRIDAIVPPGTDVGRLDQQYNPPAVLEPALRRRPVAHRSAA